MPAACQCILRQDQATNNFSTCFQTWPVDTVLLKQRGLAFISKQFSQRLAFRWPQKVKVQCKRIMLYLITRECAGIYICVYYICVRVHMCAIIHSGCVYNIHSCFAIFALAGLYLYTIIYLPFLVLLGINKNYDVEWFRGSTHWAGYTWGMKLTNTAGPWRIWSDTEVLICLGLREWDALAASGMAPKGPR